MLKARMTGLALVSALTGCASSGSPLATVTSKPEPKIVLAANPFEVPERETQPAEPRPRRVGDFLVHLLSGSFREKPALFSERVVGEENGGLIVEYRLEDNDGSRAVRAHFDGNGEVTRVLRLSGSGEEPGTLADYEALLAAVTVIPDENEGYTTSSSGTCTVGPSELDCQTKHYRVRVGDREAELGITRSHAVPGGDVSGEITAADGTVIYRSSLIEYGSEQPPTDATASAELVAPTPAPAR